MDKQRDRERERERDKLTESHFLSRCQKPRGLRPRGNMRGRGSTVISHCCPTGGPESPEPGEELRWCRSMYPSYARLKSQKAEMGKEEAGRGFVGRESGGVLKCCKDYCRQPGRAGWSARVRIVGRSGGRDDSSRYRPNFGQRTRTLRVIVCGSHDSIPSLDCERRIIDVGSDSFLILRQKGRMGDQEAAGVRRDGGWWGETNCALC